MEVDQSVLVNTLTALSQLVGRTKKRSEAFESDHNEKQVKTSCSVDLDRDQSEMANGNSEPIESQLRSMRKTMREQNEDLDALLALVATLASEIHELKCNTIKASDSMDNSNMKQQDLRYKNKWIID